ncbi:MAG: ABC transporter permease [Chitinophagales bacterium]
MAGRTISNESEKWDINITSRGGYLDFNSKELWHYRDLLMMFVKKDIITVYKQTILGPIWFVIQPILTTLMFVLVFGKIANIGTDEVPPILFYLGGLTMWNYFSETLNITSKTFTDNANIFGKVYFPRLILPLSKVISGMIKFLVQFGLFLLVWVYFFLVKKSISPNAYILLIPVLLVIMAMLSLGFGLFITSMTTKYRDLAFLVAFGVQLLMYATPVIFPLSNIQGHPRILLCMKLNPLSPLFETFKYAFFGKGGSFSLPWLLYSVGFTTILLFSGILIFNKVEKRFIDTV